METCVRRFFYEYYAADKGVPYAEGQKAKVRELKALSNCYLAAGEILHRLIALYFDRGSTWAKEWFAASGSKWFEQQVDFSRHPSHDGDNPQGKYRPKMLLEFYYRNGCEEEIAADAQRRLMCAIDNFFGDERIAELRQFLSEREPQTERRMSGLTLDGYSISGKIDLLATDRDCRTIWIVDWKMGLSEEEQSSLQLFLYAWWASRELNTEARDVHARRVFLGQPSIEKDHLLDESLLRKGKARLIQDIERMEELDRYGRLGSEGAFSRCEKEKVCAQCKYQQVCIT